MFSKKDDCLIQSFSKVIDHLPGIFCILDKQGAFQFVNNKFLEITGYRVEDIIGNQWTDFIKETSDTKKTFTYLKFENNETNFQIELIVKNGSSIQVSWTEKFNVESQYFFCTAVQLPFVEQITPLFDQFEKKVKQHRREVYDILERIKEGFIAIDEQDRVIYWNKQAELITGRTREEVLTCNIFECYPEVLKSPLFHFHQKAKKEQQPQQYEAYFPNNEKWIEVVIYPSLQGVTAFFRDITKRKIMELELEAQQKEHQKKITAAVIQTQETERARIGQELHDNINQVLTTIKLYIELSTDGIGGQDLMKKSGVLLQNCINEIRSLSKQLSAPTLGRIKMVDTIKELVESIIETGNISIIVDTSKIKDIQIPERTHLAIYRILEEHLNNILKHADASFVKISFDSIEDELILKVSDNGKGFKMNQKRSGIGIPNMISRAESLGGRLTINSAPGLGCVLIVQFNRNENVSL